MLTERDYLSRDPKRKAPVNRDVERLLKPVKRARLIPAHRLIPVFIVGLSIGIVVGYGFSDLIAGYLSP